jgi:SAM-dependent methyltransferase
VNAYDEVPYKSVPIEWTAPERLAVASILHGGPRSPLREYRVLELGCADGANLLPMAYFRPNARFVGFDGAGSQVAIAEQRSAALGLTNIEFVCADFHDVERYLEGGFDFIIAHGVFSWICSSARAAILGFCARSLRPDGLFYINYNTYPGWYVRGTIRRLLIERTRGASSLELRSVLAGQIARELVDSLADGGHPFAKLLVNELRSVAEHHHSYIAHEYLSEHNHAYWRSEFLQMVGETGLEYVADADFNYPSRQIKSQSVAASAAAPRLEDEADSADLLCYRQLHSPILCLAPRSRQPLTAEEFGHLLIASCLTVCTGEGESEPLFAHPSGAKVELREAATQEAFRHLRQVWPNGIRVGEVFGDVGHVMDDIRLLQRNGLVEIRCMESEYTRCAELLEDLPSASGDYMTDRYHTSKPSF